MTPQPLTPKRREALYAICNFVSCWGRSPLQRELATAMQLSPERVWHLLSELETTGWIARPPGGGWIRVLHHPEEFACS